MTTARLVAQLLRVVTWPHLRRHWVRTCLTCVGIALGVTTVVAIGRVSRWVAASFQHAVRTVAGDADLEITSPAGSVDDELVARMATVPGVEAATGIIESFLPLADRPGDDVLLLGIDFLGSPVWRRPLPREALHIPNQIDFIAHPDSVLVPSSLAGREQLTVGSELRILTPSGPRSLRVAGLMDDLPATQLFGGHIAVMDLPAAQLALERGSRIDRIAIKLESGVPVETARARLSAAAAGAGAAGAELVIEPPEARGAHVEKLLFSLRVVLGANSLIAVIVGGFIVYQSVAVAVGQRRRELALLNAVGVTRRSLALLCLVEVAALALLGIALGLGAGLELGQVAAHAAGGVASDIWTRIDPSEPIGSGWESIAGAAVGVAVALVAAALAVRATFLGSSVESLRPLGVTAADGASRVGQRIVLALMLLAAAWVTLFAPGGLGALPTIALIMASHASAYAGIAVLAPVIVVGAGIGAQLLAGSVRSVAVRLAAEHLPRDPTRSGMTVAMIAVAIGSAVAIACVVQSFERAWMDWMEQRFSADLLVGAGSRMRLMAGPSMSEVVADRVAHIPGVEAVEPIRTLPIRLGDRPIFLQTVSVEDRLARGGLAMVEGTLLEAAASLRSGEGVLLTDNLARRLGLHRGGRIDVPTPQGPRRFQVAGTFVDYLGSLDLGAVVVERSVMAELWNDRSSNLLRVWLAPGAATAAVRASILASLGQGYYVLTARDFIAAVRSVLDQFFALSWALAGVAAVVGIIGVVNAQLAMVVDRSAEIAVLHTVGVARRPVLWSIVTECGALGLIGGLAGVAVGVMLGAHFILGGMPMITGWRFPFVVPMNAIVGAIAIATVVSAAAGWLPARAADAVDFAPRSPD